MRRTLASLTIVTALLAAVLMPTSAFAFDVFGNACSGSASSSTVCQENNASKNAKNANPLTGPNGLLITIANIVAAVAGIVAVFIIVMSGWKYITSGGDASKVQSAKGTIIGAVIGLVVIALADVIIGFVISKL